MPCREHLTTCLCLAAAFIGLPAMAQVGSGPVVAPPPPPIIGPVDRAFSGAIILAVNATDTAHQIFQTLETIPTQVAGPLTLLYPEWETGSHAPTGTVAELAGLRITAHGKVLAWQRDGVDLHAFHLIVPAGVASIDVALQFLAPASEWLLQPDLVKLPWERLLLYPAGWYARDIPVAANVTLPPGLHAFTSLAAGPVRGDTLSFAPVSLERLVDSPVYAARYWQQAELAPGASAPVHLDLVADTAAAVVLPPDTLSALRNLVGQTAKLFGPAPYRHYDAIVSLSDVFANGGGIEHLEEGENNLPANYFTDRPHQLMNADLIAHEYVHVWNGRFRQPADLWSPDFNRPVQTDLLWVYEGQTEFWGRVLAARAGLRSRQQTLDRLALDAALVANRPARAWKSLADSSDDAIYMPGHAVAWRSWQRREDYYPEGVLLWLDIDAQLRQRSAGRFGLDDFAGRFFAAPGPTLAPRTYDFQDICAGLSALVAADWTAILRTHLDTHTDGDAMAGLARAGWQLTYTDVPSETFLQDEADAGVTDLDYAIGLQIRSDGLVKSVVWHGPAFDAGLAPGARVTAVNDHPFTPAALLEAVRTAAVTPVSLGLHARGGPSRAVIDYGGTLRYPRLQRVPGSVDWLGRLLLPRP